jgi:hypothetical protein
LHFLRSVLKASTKDGPTALVLVTHELAKEHVDFDAVANQERDTELLKRELQPTGRPTAMGEKGIHCIPLPKQGSERRAAQLAKRRPDLAEQVRAGKKRLSVALKEAGILKKPDIRKQILRLWKKASRELRAQMLDEDLRID